MDQKMMKTLGSVLAGFVVFILVLFIIASCSKTKYTFEKLESEMIKIAKSYYETKKDELPVSDKDTKTLTLKKMISDGKIKEITELFDEETKCDGSVTVTNNNGFYIYSPYLSCGDKFKTTYLKDKIIENSSVEEGIGLYEMNNQYVMRGEVLNNYVSFNNQLFRIIRINEDGTIRLMQDNGEQQRPWDNRYNPDARFNSGINEFEYNGLDSRVKEYLTNYYNDTSIWTDNAKGYIVNQDLCIGKRSLQDTSKNGSTECSKKLANQQFGLLAVYEYLQASLSENCNKTDDRDCVNYNWIANIEQTNWTITGDSESSQYAYSIYKRIEQSSCSSNLAISVVLNLTDKAIYVKGSGKKDDPYTFK